MIVRVQLKLNTKRGEGDVADFVSEFRKNEKHAMLVSALRGYMRFVGYYERKGNRFSGIGSGVKESEAVKKTEFESREYLNAENDFLSMFPQGVDDEEGNGNNHVECAESATKGEEE